MTTASDLMTAMTRLRARLRSESTPTDMQWSWSQLAALSRIIDDGPLTTSDLAQAEHMRRQSMAETVATLRRDGLIESRPDPTDGRKTLLVGTASGRELLATSVAARRVWLDIAIRSAIDDDEDEILAKATAIMLRLADSDVTNKPSR